MSFWSKLTGFFHGAAVKIADTFVAIFGKEAATQFAQGALSLLKTAEGKIVLDAVEAVQSLALDGSGKKAAAFDKIVADFKDQGKTVSESLINMLIEVAVQYLRGTVAPAA